MATYLYHCPHCGEFEVEQKITEAALTTCPRSVTDEIRVPSGSGFRLRACGEPVKRLIAGGTSFELKGPGWAKDGY